MAVQQKRLQAVTEKRADQLQQSLEFERKAAEESKEETERRKAIVQKLQKKIRKLEKKLFK